MSRQTPNLNSIDEFITWLRKQPQDERVIAGPENIAAQCVMAQWLAEQCLTKEVVVTNSTYFSIGNEFPEGETPHWASRVIDWFDTWPTEVIIGFNPRTYGDVLLHVTTHHKELRETNHETT
jgi:hypothetical protein